MVVLSVCFGVHLQSSRTLTTAIGGSELHGSDVSIRLSLESISR